MEGLHKVLGNLGELRHLNLGCFIRWISYSHTEEINCLLGQIFTLTNLEYLNLSNNDNISSIPETLANLRKLHTLDLSWCGTLQRLPANTSEIDSLKFLHTIGCFGLDRSTLPQYKSTSKISQDFVVHADYGESPGWLKISRLETVKSAKELQIIKLVEKTDITRLALEWARDAKRILDDAEVLRELEPSQSVSKFGLKGYNSVSFPSWVLRIGAYLPGLTSIGMWDLPSCKNLPPLGQLPNLRLLEISRMDKIKKIDGDLYGGTRAFPRLEKFRVYSMNCLEEWNTAYSIDEDGLNESLFPCLSFVKIRRCPMLRFKPCPPRSIKDLLVYSSDKVMLSPWRNKGHVDASATIRLHVKCCEVPLERWSLLHHLPCLEHLWIKKCSNLTCSSTDFIGGFTSLQTLTVNGCESIVSLPEKLGYLTSLTKLEIFYCRSIKTLPDTIQKLSRLQHLEILGCPELVLWCTSKENKMKLAHIKDRFVWPQYEEAETGEECETDEESEKEDLESDPEET